MNSDFYPDLIPGNFYHIYNRANGNEKLFFQERNYDYFLQRYSYYLSDYLETYAYSLLQNHFHLLVKVKGEEAILAAVRNDISPGNNSDNEIVNAAARNPISSRNRISERGPSEILIEQFRKLFISYSKAINVQETRTGSLFQKKFKRKLIDNPNYFKHVIYYIHHQPSER